MPYLLLIIATLFIVFSTGLFGGKINILSYSEFEKNLKEGKITELKLVPRGNASIYEVTGKLDGYKENETFYAKLPLSETIMERIIAEKDKKNFEINAESDPDASALLQFAINVLPMIILVGGALYFFSRQMGSSSKSLDFGKSRAKLSEDNGKVTFKDVAGLKEEKEDTEADIRYYKREIERLETRVGVGSVDYSKELVQSSIIGGGVEEALLELTQTSMYLDDAIKKLDNITALVSDKYNNFKKYNDYDKQIYTEKKLFKWSNAKISTKHNGIGKSQIYNICNKIEDMEKSGK